MNQKRLAAFTAAMITIGAITIFTSTARAAVSVYTSRPLWQAAAGSSLTEDLNSRPDGPLSVGLNSAGLLSIRVNGSVSDSKWVQGQLFGGVSTPFSRSQDLIFPTPVFSFGGDWLTTTSNAHLTAVVGGETIQFDNYLTGQGDGFLGFVSSTPFTEVRIGDEAFSGFSNEQYFLDNVSFSSVPEPASFLLVAIAVTATAGYRRR